MALNDWLKQFQEAHERAKHGKLEAQELSVYYQSRNELARALLGAQRIALEPGREPRRSLRVSRALQAEIGFFDGSLRAVTRSISASGFAVLLARPPKPDEEVKVTLRIPGGEPFSASGRAVDVKAQGGSFHVSFQWAGVSATDLERIETYVFDVVLEELKG